MKPIHTSACNMLFVAPGCDDLPGCQGEGFIATYWQPSDEEKALIAAGFPIKLSILGDQQPPVAVEVETL